MGASSIATSDDPLRVVRRVLDEQANCHHEEMEIANGQLSEATSALRSVTNERDTLLATIMAMRVGGTWVDETGAADAARADDAGAAAAGAAGAAGDVDVLNAPWYLRATRVVTHSEADAIVGRLYEGAIRERRQGHEALLEAERAAERERDVVSRRGMSYSISERQSHMERLHADGVKLHERRMEAARVKAKADYEAIKYGRKQVPEAERQRVASRMYHAAEEARKRIEVQQEAQAKNWAMMTTMAHQRPRTGGAQSHRPPPPPPTSHRPPPRLSPRP